MSDDQAYANTDRELWREGGGDGDGMSYYEPSIHVTERGGIGINVGGYVYVKTLREWHALADEQSRLARSLGLIRGLLEERRWWNNNVETAVQIAKDALLKWATNSHSLPENESR